MSIQAKARQTGENFRTNLFEEAIHASAQVKPVSEFLQTHGPGKLRHRPNPLLPSLSQTLPTSFTPLRDTKRRRPCTVKKISGHQHTIRSTEDSAQQTCIVLWIWLRRIAQGRSAGPKPSAHRSAYRFNHAAAALSSVARLASMRASSSSH